VEHLISQIWLPLTSVSSQPKRFLAGQCFSLNQEAIAAVERYFADLKKNNYMDEIMALEHYWNKFGNLKGDYFEK